VSPAASLAIGCALVGLAVAAGNARDPAARMTALTLLLVAVIAAALALVPA